MRKTDGKAGLGWPGFRIHLQSCKEGGRLKNIEKTTLLAAGHWAELEEEMEAPSARKIPRRCWERHRQHGDVGKCMVRRGTVVSGKLSAWQEDSIPQVAPLLSS